MPNPGAFETVDLECPAMLMILEHLDSSRPRPVLAGRFDVTTAFSETYATKKISIILLIRRSSTSNIAGTH
jgi:hypothetical protein